MTVAFLTLFLGLTLGVHPVTVTVAPGVTAVELLLDGSVVGSARAETGWTVPVDFGDELAPHELTAVAFDADGGELGRTRQPINLPRAFAEAEVVIDSDGSGAAAVARVSWESVTQAEPTSVAATFDGEPLAVADPRRIALPPHDPEAIHFLRVQIELGDGVTATAEAIFGGLFQDRTQTELTAVPITLDQESDGLSLSRLEGWLATADGAALTAVGLEEGPAEVVVVLDRAAQPALWELARQQLLLEAARYKQVGRLDAMAERRLRHGDDPDDDRPSTARWRREMTLRPGQNLRLLWPHPERVERAGAPVFELFPRSEEHPPADGGVFWLLSEARAPEFPVESQRLADAVAVAGMTATERAWRRAVVLVLSRDPMDASRSDPAAVRRYLAQLGVPLEVWVVGRSSREIRRQWGDEVRSVGGLGSFSAAVEDLARRLDRQRIVWVEGRLLPQEIATTERAGEVRLVR